MPDDNNVKPFPFSCQFPALRIFEAAAVSLSPPSVAIATIAAILLSISDGLIDWTIPSGGAGKSDAPPMVSLPAYWAASVNADRWIAPAARESLMRPSSSVSSPVTSAISGSADGNSQLANIIRFSIAACLWSFVGTFLCRRSAYLYAGDDESTVVRAMKYGFKKWTAALGAPLIPLSAALLLHFVTAAFGIAGRLPGVGSYWLVVVSPIVAILGFAIAFLGLATVIGWPLMIAAVATDDCDSFGSLSRTYSGLTSRPWQLAGYFLLSLLVGSILMVFANMFALATLSCAMEATAWGSGHEQANRALYSPLMTIINVVVEGVGISYFWSAATMTYLLLRQQIDGVPMDRLAADGEALPARVPLPVVGIPGTEGFAAADQSKQ